MTAESWAQHEVQQALKMVLNIFLQGNNHNHREHKNAIGLQPPSAPAVFDDHMLRRLPHCAPPVLGHFASRSQFCILQAVLEAGSCTAE